MPATQTLSYDRFSQAYLKDFDWKVQLLVGSDKMASMKEAHLVLNLTLHKQDGTSEDIILELSKDELDHFINTLEKAQKTVNVLRA